MLARRRQSVFSKQFGSEGFGKQAEFFSLFERSYTFPSCRVELWRNVVTPNVPPVFGADKRRNV